MSNDATALITQTSTAYALDQGLAASDEACPACSQSIAAGEMYCPRCGYQRGTWGAGSRLAGGTSGSAMPAGPPSPWLLRAADGREWRLSLGEQAAGRGEVELKLDDDFASRRHARFVATSDALTVEDLGSSNGSFIGAVRLDPGTAHSLDDGGSVRIGQTELTVARSEPEAGAGLAESTTLLPAETAAVADELPATASEAAPFVPSGWKLVAEQGLEILLPIGDWSLGRKADRCEQVVEGDTFISGLHCSLTASEGALSVTDLGSTNGTFVNDEALAPNAPRTLEAGDRVRIGQSGFAVARDSDTEPAGT